MYAKILNQTIIKFPYSFDDLQNENPYSNFGNIDVKNFIETYSNTEDAHTTGCELILVELESKPQFNIATEKLVLSDTPVYENEKWILKYSIVTLTQEEKNEIENIQASDVRRRRNELLSDSDWIVIKSFEKQEIVPNLWQVYRQELRDLSNQPEFPWNITWPISPN